MEKVLSLDTSMSDSTSHRRPSTAAGKPVSFRWRSRSTISDSTFLGSNGRRYVNRVRVAVRPLYNRNSTQDISQQPYGYAAIRRRSSGFNSSPSYILSPIVNEAGEAEQSTTTTANIDVVDLNWYPFWLERQHPNIPASVKELRINSGKCTLADKSAFKHIFKSVRRFVRNNEGVSIDEIVQHLQETEVLEEAEELLDTHRLLIFAVLGWMTMVYVPEFNVCSLNELAINRTEPDSGMIFDDYKVPVDFTERPLSVLLKGFGNLLPARSSESAQVASESSKMASSWVPIFPDSMNAHKLHILLGVNIRWVDTLSLHLDYDKSSKTLSLFSFPSFCLAMLKSRGPIYAFASIEKDRYDPRATAEDITLFLQEVLLSFRLLFGQSVASRKYFRQIFKPIEVLGYRVDALLPIICAKKDISSLVPDPNMPADRPIYHAGRDFPVLYDRIDVIFKELRDFKPDSMKALALDRRDRLQWWTFWLVSIFGGISIILSLVQVVLQAVQLAQS